MRSTLSLRRGALLGSRNLNDVILVWLLELFNWDEKSLATTVFCCVEPCCAAKTANWSWVRRRPYMAPLLAWPNWWPFDCSPKLQQNKYKFNYIILQLIITAMSPMIIIKAQKTWSLMAFNNYNYYIIWMLC
jgi:hypothetical protein